MWETEQLRTVLKTSRYFQALLYPDNFQINPLAYARGLAKEIERLGVSAQQVVVASGGYTDHTVKPLFHSFIPIATYGMHTRARPDLVETAVRTSYGVVDQRRAGDYYRLVDEGARILWGRADHDAGH